MSPWRLSATEAGSGEELGASGLGSVLSFPLSLFCPICIPSYLPRWEIMRWGMAGSLQVPFNYCVCSRNQSAWGLPLRQWGGSVPAHGVSGGRGFQESEAEGSLCRNPREGGAAWHRESLRTVSPCGASVPWAQGWEDPYGCVLLWPARGHQEE